MLYPIFSRMARLRVGANSGQSSDQRREEPGRAGGGVLDYPESVSGLYGGLLAAQRRGEGNEATTARSTKLSRFRMGANVADVAAGRLRGLRPGRVVAVRAVAGLVRR